MRWEDLRIQRDLALFPGGALEAGSLLGPLPAEGGYVNDDSCTGSPTFPECQRKLLLWHQGGLGWEREIETDMGTTDKMVSLKQLPHGPQ